MGRSFKGLSCLLVCLFLAGCSEAVKSASRVLDPNSSKAAQTVGQDGPAGSAQNFCLLDPTAAISKEAAASPAPDSSGNAPAVEVPVTSHDFGKVTAESEAVHEFSVYNAGNAVLNIKKVLPG